MKTLIALFFSAMAMMIGLNVIAAEDPMPDEPTPTEPAPEEPGE